jgi:hypothetical protein
VRQGGRPLGGVRGWRRAVPLVLRVCLRRRCHGHAPSCSRLPLSLPRWPSQCAPPSHLPPLPRPGVIQHEGPRPHHRSQSWPSLARGGGGGWQGGHQGYPGQQAWQPPWGQQQWQPGPAQWPQQGAQQQQQYGRGGHHLQPQASAPPPPHWQHRPDPTTRRQSPREAEERADLITRARGGSEGNGYGSGGNGGLGLEDWELRGLGWTQEELGIATGDREEEEGFGLSGGEEEDGGGGAASEGGDGARPRRRRGRSGGSEPVAGAVPGGRAAGGDGIARHGLALRSAYAAATGFEPSFTSCHNKYKGTLDYIWYSDAEEAGGGKSSSGGGSRPARSSRLALSAVLLPPPPHLVDCPPNRAVPSDHLPLAADFVLSL